MSSLTADAGGSLRIVDKGRDHCWQDVPSRPVLGREGKRGEGLLLVGHPVCRDMHHTAAEGIHCSVRKLQYNFRVLFSG